jgi:hypothetical protein
MDQQTRMQLQMVDRVAMLEPGLRDTLKAARLTAISSLVGGFIALGNEFRIVVRETREHKAWASAQAIFLDAEKRVSEILAGLAANADAVSANRTAQELGSKERQQMEIDFLSSVQVDDETSRQIQAYIDYQIELMHWGEQRKAGNHGAVVPADVPREVFETAWRVLQTDTSGRREAIQAEGQALQIEQGRLGQEFRTLREQLAVELSKLDGVATATDQANLTAAKWLVERFRPLEHKKPRLKEIARSAVRTCTAVSMLAERVQVVKNHPSTMGDVGFTS